MRMNTKEAFQEGYKKAKRMQKVFTHREAEQMLRVGYDVSTFRYIGLVDAFVKGSQDAMRMVKKTGLFGGTVR